MAYLVRLGRFTFNLKSITVEPIMFLYMYMTYTQFLTFQALIYQKVCLDNYNESICDILNKNKTLKTEEDFVQKHTSTWLLYNNLAFAIPSVFTVFLFLGPWGDLVGRKIPLIFPIVGALLYSACNILNSVFIRAHLGYLLIGNFVNGCSGGFIGMLMACHSYITHITAPENRIVRIGILQGMSFLSSTFGTAVSGIMLDRTSFVFVFSVLAVILVVTLLYTLVWVDNIVPEAPEKGTKGWCKSLVLDSIKDVCICVYNKRTSKNFMNVVLLLLMTLLVMITIVGENDVILVYTRHPPLSWSQTTLGLFKGSEQFLRGLAVITLLPLLKKRFGMKDTTIVIIGLISNCAEEIVLGLSSSTALLFIGGISGCLMGFSYSGLRSLTSNMVEIHEQGKVFTLVAVVESISTLAATSLYNTVYRATLDLYDGFCFLMGAGLIGLCIFISVFLHIKLIKSPVEKYENLQEDVEETIDESMQTAIET